METTTSSDGTRIAFDRTGAGSPVILVAGATCTRGVTAPLAQALSAHHTVLNPDRRGRGDSDDHSGAPPWSVDREIEDLAALVEAAGGRASLYGHSSGAGLVVRAAAAGLPVDRLVLHDAPYNLPGDELHGVSWHEQLHGYLGVERPADAVEAFMRMVGVPDEALTGMKQAPFWPAMVAVAPTLAYDSAAMGDADGGLVPVELLARIDVPTLVLVGGADHPFMVDIAHAIADALPNGRFEQMIGAGHDVGAEVVAPRLLPFLAG